MISFIASGFQQALAFLTIILLARWLGPSEYGRLAFLIASFVAFLNLTDLYSSSAFFTFLSERKRHKKFVHHFFFWLLFQFCLFLVIIAFVVPEAMLLSVWFEHDRSMVVLAFLASFSHQYIWPICNKMGEAQKKTVHVQILCTLVAVTHLLFVVSLHTFDALNLEFILTGIAIQWGLGALLGSMLYATDQVEPDVEKIAPTVKVTFLEFRKFCLPLVPLAFISFVYTFSDRWMLREWMGDEAQAYFSLGLFISAAVLLVAKSSNKILWKEISEANYVKNAYKINQLHRLVTAIQILIGFAIVWLIIPWSSELILLALGNEYLSASIVFGLMMFYPVYQGLWQMNGLFLAATKATSILSLVSGAHLITNIILSYLIIAPRDAIIPGLGLSLTVLVVKMVAVQFVFSNIITWWVSKRLVSQYSFHGQFFCICFFAPLGLLTSYIGKAFAGEQFIFGFSLSCLIYCLVSFVFVTRYPYLFGFNSNDYKFMVHKLSSAFLLIWRRGH